MISEPRFHGGDAAAALELVVSPRAKAMRLRVDPKTGRVLLTLPRRASRRRALAWAEEHRAWIEAQLASIPPAVPLLPAAVIPLEGEPHRIDWNGDRSRRVRLEGDRILVGGPIEGAEGRVLRWLQRHALDILSAETAEYAARARVTVARVGIGDPVSRWGSCASSGAIRYNWRLILAPRLVRRATVAHEVAHRVHMNHGPDFHALVAAIFEADPRAARLWLRQNGAALHGVGRRRPAR